MGHLLRIGQVAKGLEAEGGEKNLGGDEGGGGDQALLGEAAARIAGA